LLYNKRVVMAGAAAEMIMAVGAEAAVEVAQLLPILALVVEAVVVGLPHHRNRLAMAAGAVVAAEEQAVPNDPPLTLPCHGH
jgi:hypothetical protein